MPLTEAEFKKGSKAACAFIVARGWFWRELFVLDFIDRLPGRLEVSFIETLFDDVFQDVLTSAITERYGRCDEFTIRDQNTGRDVVVFCRGGYAPTWLPNAAAISVVPQSAMPPGIYVPPALRGVLPMPRLESARRSAELAAAWADEVAGDFGNRLPTAGTWLGVNRASDAFWKSQRLAPPDQPQTWGRVDGMTAKRVAKPEAHVSLGPRKYFDDGD